MPPALKAANRRVAVLAGSSITWREQVIRGIASFAAENTALTPWQIYTAPEGVEDALFFTESYRWDGLIVRVVSQPLVNRIRKLGVPAVSIGSVRIGGNALPRVRVDDDALVAVGLRHLLASGIRRFAYCGPLIHGISEDRSQAFARAAKAAGYEVDIYQPRQARAGIAWQVHQRDLMQWLKRLKKPVGVLTWNPDVACQLMEAAHRAGVEVPAEVAVLSGDEDTIKCTLSTPTISALEVPSARIGYEAAAMLARLMDGRPATVTSMLIPPAGILHVRESTNVADAMDRDMHAAREFIRRHAAERLTTLDIARHLQISRRTLERHFARVFGRSVREEIRSVRLESASHLLLKTDLSVARIAKACGFGNPSYFITAFSADRGRTPAAFRTAFRPNPGRR